MSSTTYSPPSTRGGGFKASLLFGALFPVFLAAALIWRALPFSAEDGSPPKSVIGETRENLSIAISYALMARAMLQSFARD
ncbi:hypothetical protein [Methylocystis echinoides]|jgi:hypothetical protein|uniref:hypothetical protein n=1 Tax=Methylocystis echinoides TaxID=29468 RepID=UPI00343C7017